jgi:hypothetical protein
MKHLLIIVCIVLTACGGSLSDEQRRKIKEDMAHHKIVRVTDAEVTAGAFAYGRKIMKGISSIDKNSLELDSLSRIYQAKIVWIVPGEKSALAIEQQLIEAYLESLINGGMQDNVQRLKSDSLLYTFPVTEKLADGSETVKGMWSIRISKKDLILSMNK